MWDPNDNLIPTTREEREQQKWGFFDTLKGWWKDPLGNKRKQEIAQNLQDQADQQLWDEYQKQCNHIKSVIAGKTSLDEFVPHYDIEHYQKLHDKITGARSDYQKRWQEQFIDILSSNPHLVALVTTVVNSLWVDHPFSKRRTRMVEVINKVNNGERDYYQQMQELTLSMTGIDKKDQSITDFLWAVSQFQEIEQAVDRGVSEFQSSIKQIVNNLNTLDELTTQIQSISQVESQVEILLINKPEATHLLTHNVQFLLTQLNEYRQRYQGNMNPEKIADTKNKLEEKLIDLIKGYITFVDQEAIFLTAQQQKVTDNTINKIHTLWWDDLTSLDMLIENTHQIKEIKDNLINQVSNIDNKKWNLIDGLIQFIDHLDYQWITIEDDKKKLLSHVIIPSYYTDQLKQPTWLLVQKIIDYYWKESQVVERMKLDQMRTQFLKEYKQFEEFQKTIEALQQQWKIRLQWLSDRYSLQLQKIQWTHASSTNSRVGDISSDYPWSQTSIDKLIDQLPSIKPDTWDTTLIEKPIPVNTLDDLFELYNGLLGKLGLPIIPILDWLSEYILTTQDIHTLQRSIHTWIVALISGDTNDSIQSGSLSNNNIIMNYSCHTTGMNIELSYWVILTNRLSMIDNRINAVSDEWLKNHNNQSRTQLRKVFDMAEQHLTSGRVKIQTHNGLTESYFTDKRLEGKTNCLAHQWLRPHPNWTQGEYEVDGEKWANQYKTLTDYNGNDRFFWEEWKAMINDTQALVYKWVIDGNAGTTPEEQKQHLDEFIQAMKEQCYDKWYDWLRKKDFIDMMDIYFPADQVETNDTKDTKDSRLYWLFGMMLLTWWEWRAWFQEGNEMSIDEKTGKLVFNNTKKWVSRSAMELFANARWVVGSDRDGDGMSLLFSRSC